MRIAEYPVWLAVMPDQRDAARADAGKHPDGRSAIAWSQEDQLWFARPGADMRHLQAWLPDSTRRSGGGDPEAEFLDALTDAGLIIDGLPVMDGEIHRVSVRDGPKGNGDGVYRGFLNGTKPGGWFINYWTAKSHKDITKWKATGGESDPVARVHMRAVARQAKDDAARALAVLHDRQTRKARSLYDVLPAADAAHPYLIRKGITATPALRQTNNGALVVPFYDVNGQFRTLQYIPPAGEKYLYKQAPKAGHFLVVGGALRNGEPILYAEGYATARSLNLVIGRPVVMTIDAGNMVNVASVLKAGYPDSPHVFLADVDHEKTVNTGLMMAEQAARNTGGAVLTPDFTARERRAGMTDFNDIHQSRGTDGLRADLLPQLHEALERLNYKDAFMSTPDDAQPAPNALLPDAPSVAAEPVAEERAFAPADVAPATTETDTPDAVPVMKDLAERGATGQAAPPGAADAPPDRMAVATEMHGGKDETDRLLPRDVAEKDASHDVSPRAGERASAAAPEPAAPESPAVDVASASTAAFGEEDTILVGPRRVAPSDDDAPVNLKRLDADRLLSRVTHETQPDGKSVLYKLDGEPAFYDRGNRLVMAEGAGTQEEKVLAALLTAAAHYRGRIELTGSETFKAFAISVIVANKLDVSMKVASQQAALDEARRAAGQPVAPADAVRGNPDADRPDTVPPSGPVPADAPERNDARVTLSPEPVTPTVPAASTTPAISPAVHTPAEKAREPVTGKVTACGQAPFRFEPDATESTYITLRNREGTQTFWGKELAGLLRETNLKPGRMVTLQWMGEQPVLIKVPQKNDQGVVTHYKTVDTHRNQWSLAPVGGSRVQTGGDELISLSAFDAARYTQVQHAVMSRLKLDMPAPPVPKDGLYWLRPDGQGSATAGDALTAARPPHNAHAGAPVMSSWAADGTPDLYLVQGDGHYLQGVVRQAGEYQHVLVSLPDSKTAPPMVVNLLTPEGAVPLGSGNGINRSNGQSVPREHVVIRLTGDAQPRIAKLDTPAELPPALHARLGYDERYKAEPAYAKAQPAAAPQAAPVTPPRPA